MKTSRQGPQVSDASLDLSDVFLHLIEQAKAKLNHATGINRAWPVRLDAALANENCHAGLLHAAQILRAADALDEDAAFYIISCASEHLAWNLFSDDPEFEEINRKLRTAEKVYGLYDDEYWPRGKAPADVENLLDAWETRAHEIKATVLSQYREDHMANLLLNNRDEYHRRSEEGRKTLLGCLLTPLP